MDLVVEIVQMLVSGIVEMGKGIGEGLGETAKAIFLDTSTPEQTKLSIFGTVIIAFAAISLAVGLTTMVTKWIMSLGARN